MIEGKKKTCRKGRYLINGRFWKFDTCFINYLWFLTGFTLLLVSKLYRSYFVCGTKINEIVFSSDAWDRGSRVTSQFRFKTKDGKLKT